MSGRDVKKPRYSLDITQPFCVVDDHPSPLLSCGNGSNVVGSSREGLLVEIEIKRHQMAAKVMKKYETSLKGNPSSIMFWAKVNVFFRIHGLVTSDDGRLETLQDGDIESEFGTIRRIAPNSPADLDGRLKIGDCIMRVNGSSRVDLLNRERRPAFLSKLETSHLTLLVRRQDESNTTETNRILSQDFGESLVREPRFTDFVFVVKGEEIPSYKLLVAERSPVFRAMLTHDMKEKLTNVVTIDEFDPPVIKTLLKFMYTNRLEPELGNLEHLFQVARAGDMYQVQNLKELCLEKLKFFLNKETAVDMLLNAESCGLLEEELADVILVFMTVWFDEIAASDKWPILEKKPNLISGLCRMLGETKKRVEQYGFELCELAGNWFRSLDDSVF